MTETAKMIERIKALLAKAASTDHEAEALAFFNKAHELMEKHQLDATDLDKSDPLGNEQVAHRKGQAAPDWDFRLMFAVARYFGCKAIQLQWWGEHPKTGNFTWLGHYMDIIGRESARVTAVEMHKYLVATVRRLGREMHEKDSRRTADGWSRWIGNALRTRIHELAPTPESAKTETARANALVTVDQVLALYKKLHPDARPINGTTWSNPSAREIAEGIGLNVQVNNEGTKRLK